MLKRHFYKTYLPVEMRLTTKLLQNGALAKRTCLIGVVTVYRNKQGDDLMWKNLD